VTLEFEQQGFDFDITGERREVDSRINDIRTRVDRTFPFWWIQVRPHTRPWRSPVACAVVAGWPCPVDQAMLTSDYGQQSA
jgi:hypothetical protein